MQTDFPKVAGYMHTVDLIFKRTFIPNFRMEKVCAGSWVEAVGKSSDTLRGNII